MTQATEDPPALAIPADVVRNWLAALRRGVGYVRAGGVTLDDLEQQIDVLLGYAEGEKDGVSKGDQAPVTTAVGACRP